MNVSCNEGVASQIGPESSGDDRKIAVKALTRFLRQRGQPPSRLGLPLVDSARRPRTNAKHSSCIPPRPTIKSLTTKRAFNGGSYVQSSAYPSHSLPPSRARSPSLATHRDLPSPPATSPTHHLLLFHHSPLKLQHSPRCFPHTPLQKITNCYTPQPKEQSPRHSLSQLLNHPPSPLHPPQHPRSSPSNHALHPHPKRHPPRSLPGL
jgi:hypothetical protein